MDANLAGLEDFFEQQDAVTGIFLLIVLYAIMLELGGNEVGTVIHKFPGFRSDDGQEEGL